MGLILICADTSYLRQHGVLPPPGHADAQQVIDGGGVLHAALPRLPVLRGAADHCLATGL